ncbi:MAG: hypothetical protein K9H48_06900 [Melioribacteraceae bacterium]|nr:hypothetical protein [Melioribacteraceae bacterium]MCF8394701.1 hypothetical protein [Melioribacteraceae bacterium]MCF8418086.1 hypothetical protein [Melioribacteraceae bacterium]
MKLAIATDDYKVVTGHVGRCKGFLVIDVEDGEIKNVEERPNTFTSHHRQEGGSHRHGNGHGAGHGHHRLAEGLSDCSHLICCGCGWRLVDDLKQFNIEPVLTNEQDAREAAIKFEKGELDIFEDNVCTAH